MDKNQFFSVIFILSIVFFTHTESKSIDSIERSLPKNESRSDDPRIIGGKKAVPGEFKGIVSLQLVFPYINQHICGGTLINATIVLTAAHCVVHRGTVLSSEKLVVVGDDMRTFDYGTNPRRQTRNIKKIVVHKEYDAERPKNDIALIVLEKPFLNSRTFEPVNVTKSGPIDDESCRVAGWGSKYTDTPFFPEYLMAVNISIIPMKICNSTSSYNGQIPIGAVCAGEMAGGRDSCQGDSGGGLICDGVVKGIVSWGDSCAKKNFPGVYSDVFQYKEWIEKNSISSGNPLTSMIAMTFSFVGMIELRKLLF